MLKPPKHARAMGQPLAATELNHEDYKFLFKGYVVSEPLALQQDLAKRPQHMTLQEVAAKHVLPETR